MLLLNFIISLAFFIAWFVKLKYYDNSEMEVRNGMPVFVSNKREVPMLFRIGFSAILTSLTFIAAYAIVQLCFWIEGVI